MTIQKTDPLYVILRSKRESTKFQILVEIAEHQPAVRQQEIAEKMGVTPQAVSEYIRELADDGMVNAQGRGRYTVTPSGIEWVVNNAEALESYAHHVTHEIIQQVTVWTATASEHIHKGDSVGIYMKDGILYASHEKQTAMGVATLGAASGQDVGIEKLSGIIDLSEGVVHVCKVPRILRGGSRLVDYGILREVLSDVGYIGVVGLEARITVTECGFRPDAFFGAREGVIEAASHGIDCAMVIVDEEFTDFLKKLEVSGLCYEIHDLVIACT